MSKPGGFRTVRRGIVTIEFALVSPLLLLMLAGVLDYGMYLRTAACVADAARSGAEFGSLSTANAANLARMQSTALSSSPGLSGLTATASQSCQCAGSAASCSSSCGGKLTMYVRVTAKATAPLVFRYSGLPFSGVVSYTTSIRVQ
jgi:Flp pilus assembly protein TadG